MLFLDFTTLVLKNTAKYINRIESNAISFILLFLIIRVDGYRDVVLSLFRYKSAEITISSKMIQEKPASCSETMAKSITKFNAQSMFIVK